MSTASPQPIPNDLREWMMKFIANAPEHELPEIHKRLLIAERDRLWTEVQEQAQADFDAGKYANLEELIREYRARNKSE